MLKADRIQTIISHLQTTSNLHNRKDAESNNARDDIQEGRRPAQKVNEHRGLSDGVHLVSASPHATVNRVVLEQLHSVLDLIHLSVLRVFLHLRMRDNQLAHVKHYDRRRIIYFTYRAVALGHIRDQQPSHHGIGGLLLKDLKRLEIRHAAVGPAEGLVGHHRQGGGGGRDGGGHDTAGVILDHRAPVLQALRQSVVGSLGDGQPVHYLDVILQRGQRVLAQEFAHREQLDDTLQQTTGV